MLSLSKPVAFVPTKNSGQARPFYEQTLGLRFIRDDHFALIFDVNGVTLRVAGVPDFKPFPFTILGWDVLDVQKAVSGLKEKGVTFERFAGMEQDELGIWTAPDGCKVAWFKDPDGNLLSVSDSSAQPA